MGKQIHNKLTESQLTYKVERATTTVVDRNGGRIHAIVSTEAKDRQGDIIRQAAWDLKNFLAHPVLLSSHNYMSLQSQIGEWETMQVKGSHLEGIAKYYIGLGNEEADWAFVLASKGRAAYSVGFKPDISKVKELKDGEDSWPRAYEYNGQELLEVSQVTVPANPEALQEFKALMSTDMDKLMEAMVKSRSAMDEAIAMMGKKEGIRNISSTAVKEIADEVWQEILKTKQQSSIPVVDLMQAIRSGMKGV